MDIFISITLLMQFQERLVQRADVCVMREHLLWGRLVGKVKPFHENSIRELNFVDVGSQELQMQTWEAIEAIWGSYFF